MAWKKNWGYGWKKGYKDQRPWSLCPNFCINHKTGKYMWSYNHLIEEGRCCQEGDSQFVVMQEDDLSSTQQPAKSGLLDAAQIIVAKSVKARPEEREEALKSLKLKGAALNEFNALSGWKGESKDSPNQSTWGRLNSVRKELDTARTHLNGQQNSILSLHDKLAVAESKCGRLN